MRLAWARPLGGAGAAQPLYLAKIAIGGRRRNVYLTASESGRVSAFDAVAGRQLWTRELGALSTGCAEMPGGIFGVTSTPVYDPTSGFVYVAEGAQLWALDVRTGASRAGWPVPLPLDDTHEHVWGALALAAGHVYMGTASYCDRRPYTGRVLSVSTSSGVVDHSWVTVTTADGSPGGGSIWGWGGIAITGHDLVWAAVGNANTAASGDETQPHGDSVAELSSALALIGSGAAIGIPPRGDYGFGSTPIVFKPSKCAPLVTAEGKDGALYVWRTANLQAGSMQRLVLAFPATLYGSPAWDPTTQLLYLTTTQGYAGAPSGLDALAVTGDCTLRRVWTRSLGGQLNAIPTVVNDTVVVATGTGQLRAYAAATGKLLMRRVVHGAVFDAPIAVGRDVAVVTWNHRLVVYRLPPARR